MSRILDELPPELSRGRLPVYPWAAWMDGRVHEIARGIDFQPRTESMARVLHMRADKSGHRVVIRRVDDDTLAFQFTPKESS